MSLDFLFLTQHMVSQFKLWMRFQEVFRNLTCKDFNAGRKKKQKSMSVVSKLHLYVAVLLI